MLESDEYRSVEELAEAERINSSYLSRVLRLTLVAPDIVDAILDGRQPAGLTMANLTNPLPLEWKAQRQMLKGQCRRLSPAASGAGRGW